MERIFLMFLDHTQRHTTVGRTPLDELITRPEESYRLWCVVVCDLETSRICAPYIYIYDISSLRVKFYVSYILGCSVENFPTLRNQKHFGLCRGNPDKRCRWVYYKYVKLLKL